MLTAQELRIGNLVYLFKGVSDNGAEWKEYSIDSGFDLYKLDENDCADIKPIPITEEWLLRLGFVLKTGWWVKSRLELFNINGKYFTTPSKDIVSVDILYIHQLQNLYFALTGRELTIKQQTNG